MSFSSVAEHAVFNFDLIGLLLCPTLLARPSGFVSTEALCYKKEAMHHVNAVPGEAQR